MLRLARPLVAVAITAALSAASADVIVLNNGTRQVGIIKSQDKATGAVTIVTIAGEITVPGNRIADVQRDPPAASYTQLGDQYLEAAQFQKAADEYRKALELRPDDAVTSTKLALAQAGISEARVTDAAKEADRVRRVVQNARDLTAKKQFEAAAETLKPLANTGGTLSPAVRSAFVELYTAWGIDRLDRVDPAGAAQKFQAGLRLDPGNEQLTGLLMKAWQGDPSKMGEVVNSLKNSKNPNDRLKLANAYFRQRDYENALPIYQELHSNPATDSDLIRQRLQLLYDTLHRRYAERGNYAKALETFRAFLEFSPTEDPAPYYRYEYMAMKQTVKATDVEGRIRLATYAEQTGMNTVAKQEYFNILQLDPQSSGALAGISRFAQYELDNAQEFYDTQQWTMAMTTSRQIDREYGSLPNIQRQAREIYNKAEQEFKKAKLEEKENAERLAQRGDQYYQQALGYVEMYVSSDRDTSIRAVNPRWDAVRYFDMAISTWQEALRINPQLGQTSSYDLYRKMADAQAKRNSLGNTQPLPYARQERIY